MSILLVRILILYVLVFAVIRLSGKRQLSQLQPFDLVITLLIADLASRPMEDPSVPLSYGVVPIVSLFLLQKLVAYIVLKSKKIRKIACGSPLVIINNGKLEENTMRQANYSVEDLIEHLRTMSIFDLSDVWYAILETNGDLSVMLRKTADVPTCSDLNVCTKQDAVSQAVIIDGDVMEAALNSAGKDIKWLQKQLLSAGVTDTNSIFCAQTTKDNGLFIQTKEKNGGKLYIIAEKEK